MQTYPAPGPLYQGKQTHIGWTAREIVLPTIPGSKASGSIIRVAGINEIARCLNMPFNIAAGNSSGYNYASGRLDHQVFFKAIRIDQAYLADVVLDRILKAWIDEVVPIPRHRWRRTSTQSDRSESVGECWPRLARQPGYVSRLPPYMLEVGCKLNQDVSRRMPRLSKLERGDAVSGP